MLSHPLRAAVGNSPADPNFKSVVTLLHGDGTNGAQNNTFIDSSTNNYSITRNGNTTQGSFSPFLADGYWSAYFDGNGDYLTISSNTALAFGTGDFTVECWVHMLSSSTMAVNDYSSAGGFGFKITSTQIIAFTSQLTSYTANAIASPNVWNHIAFVRTGTTLKTYLNGAEVGSFTVSTNFTSPSTLTIGRNPGGGTEQFYGYISNLRFVKGTAVYTANFTPPSSPLTAVTNTQLLVCQSNWFKDNSSNAFSVTKNGDVSIQPFNPFGRPGEYSANNNGGSAYFDGTGDYLSISDGTISYLGTADFTIEGWWYFSDTSNQAMVSKYASLNGFIVQYQSGNLKLTLSTGVADNVYSFSWTPEASAWYHIAITRSGTSGRAFVNGKQIGTTQTFITANGNPTATGLQIGSTQSISELTRGFASNIRIVKGTAVYTADFTVPSSPLTAITNTMLLLNCTNAGIFDNAAIAEFETVGNVQISTTQKKFGTASLYFDGAGDYLVPSGNNINLALGSGDWTIEFWLYLSSNQSSIIYDGRPSGGTGITPAIYTSTNELRYAVNGVDRILAGSALVSATWYHVALCKSGSSTKMFVNGTQVGSSYSDSNTYVNSTGRPVIGASGNSLGTSPLNGYIDDLRITKGIARYTANFTAPTAAFPNR